MRTMSEPARALEAAPMHLVFLSRASVRACLRQRCRSGMWAAGPSACVHNARCTTKPEF